MYVAFAAGFHHKQVLCVKRNGYRLIERNVQFRAITQDERNPHIVHYYVFYQFTTAGTIQVLGLYLIAVLIKKPFSVNDPVVYAALILCDSDNRSNTVISVLTGHSHLIALVIQEPFSVESPIIDAVGIHPHTYYRRISVRTVGTVLTILSVFSVMDGDGISITEFYQIAVIDIPYIRDIQTFLEGRNDGLHRRYVLVHLSAKFL